MNIEINIPQPIDFNPKFAPVTTGENIDESVQSILKGDSLVVGDYYSTGLTLLHELQGVLKKKFPNKSFDEQREYRAEFQKFSQNILLEVINHKLTARKSPSIGWLEKLYPDNEGFLLPFPQVQGLNSSWQWYSKGVAIPGLRNKIYPYYGSYFPTRFEHLTLFDNWLKRYKGDKKEAFDIGIGSGILSLQMIKHGFQKVFGTDTNPNSIFGLNEEWEGSKTARKIELDHGNLFGKWTRQVELIVFNPPWLPAGQDVEGKDEAIYYNDSLFPKFFEEAYKRLLPGGKIVLLFSNLGKLTNAKNLHPIELELDQGGRFNTDLFLQKKVKLASDKTKRDRHWRKEEKVQLWELSKI